MHTREIRTYKQAQDYILEVPKFTTKNPLEETRGFYHFLQTREYKEQKLGKIIHIAGTNGKGSFGAYLASICKEAGFKVGRYCSPAVFEALECWQYDGRNITEEEYANAMSQVKTACDIVVSRGILPTAFELETALAFVYFAKMQPSIKGK